MKPELETLLDLQAKDLVLLEVDQRLDALLQEEEALDEAVARAVAAVATAERGVADATRRRVEVEGKVETFRKLQEGRRKRIEVSRPGKDTAQLVAELDLSRQVLASAESDWFKADETVKGQEARVAETTAQVEALREEQQGARTEIAGRRAALDQERAAALDARNASAEKVESPLRARYERLRNSRTAVAVVALAGDACGACHTAVPMNRRSQMRVSGLVDGCEVCGVLLYYSGPS